ALTVRRGLPLPGDGGHGRVRVEPGRATPDGPGGAPPAGGHHRLPGRPGPHRPPALAARSRVRPSGAAPDHQLSEAAREGRWTVPAVVPLFEPAAPSSRLGWVEMDPG